MAKDRMVYCRVCGEQIASSAKRCPKCGAKQKKGHGFRNFMILLILIGLGYYVYSHGLYEDVSKRISAVKNKTTVSTEKDTREPDTKKPAKVSSSPAKTSPSAAAATPSPAEVSPSPAEVKEQASEQTSGTESGGSAAAGVSPDFKAFMDSYESFMNEYCDFMETYDETDASAMIRYASLLSKYADFAAKVDQYNEENLSAEDYKYYIDVMARVQKRMIDASM